MTHPEHKPGPQDLKVVTLEELEKVFDRVPFLSFQREEIARRLEAISRQREAAGIAPKLEIPPVSPQLDLMRREIKKLRGVNQTLREDLAVTQGERNNFQERLGQILTQGLKTVIGTLSPGEFKGIIETLDLQDEVGETLASRFEQLEPGEEEKPFFSGLRRELIQMLGERIVDGGVNEDFRKEVSSIIAEQLLERMVAKDVSSSLLMSELIAKLQEKIVEGEAPDELIETLIDGIGWSWESLLETLREFFRVSDVRLNPQEEKDLEAAARLAFSRWRPRSVPEEQTHLHLP